MARWGSDSVIEVINSACDGVNHLEDMINAIDNALDVSFGEHEA